MHTSPLSAPMTNMGLIDSKRLCGPSYFTLCVSCHFLCRSPFCEEIVCCRGDHVRLAVRVRVFVYPESACAVWLMFACKYRSVLWPTDGWYPKTTSLCCTWTQGHFRPGSYRFLDIAVRIPGPTMRHVHRHAASAVMLWLLFCNPVDFSFVQTFILRIVFISIFVNKWNFDPLTVYLKTFSSRWHPSFKLLSLLQCCNYI